MRQAEADKSSHGAGHHQPKQQQSLEVQQRQSIAPGRAKNSEQGASGDVAPGPPRRAKYLPQQRLRHIGPNDVFLPEEFVSGRDLPVLAARLDVPMCLQLGIQVQRPAVHRDRPNLLKTPPGSPENAVIARGTLRDVSLDIEDVPAPDHAASPNRAAPGYFTSSGS